MLGSGALVVCAEGTCMLDMALNAVRFFRNESCGKCVPCRVGSQKLVDILTGWTQGKSSPADDQLIEELTHAPSDVDLRAGAGSAGADRFGAEALPGRGRGAHHAPGVSVWSLLCERREHSMSPNALVELTIDGKRVSVPAGTTVFDAARMNGISIPTLCHQQNETPVGVCRVCVVDVGRPIYAASCVRPVEPGLVVTTNSDKVIQARRTLLELLMSDHPTPCLRQQHSRDCELEALAKQAGITQPRFARRTVAHGNDDSSLAIAVNFDACILCDRCIRGCNEVRGNFVLGRMGKGAQAGIAFDHNLPMRDSSCVSCGECMVSCPTGALTNKKTLPIHAGPDHNAKIAEPDELLRLPVFKGVSGTFLELNKGAIVRRQFRRGEIICKEGEYGSTAFFILEGKSQVSIRSPIAHVKTQDTARGFLSKMVSTLARRKEHPREEEANRRHIPIDAPADLAYENPVAEMGPGDLFGEMTCMSFYPRSATVRALTDCTMYEMNRNVLDILQRNKTFKERLDSTYRERALSNHLRGVPIFAEITDDFLDHLRKTVELVRIDGEDFQQMIERFPQIRRGLEAAAQERLQQNRDRLAIVRSVPLDHFLAQGLMEAQSLLILDLEKCTRCDACVRACADAHNGVTRLVREGLRFDKYLVATSCRQCRDPLCMVGCPVGSIRRRNSLEVIIEDWCIGCGLCAKNCPYGNINLHE